MSAILVAIGLAIIGFGVLGTIILPDIFLRLHASTKCGVTGTVTVLLGLVFQSGSAAMAFRLLLIIVFIFWVGPLIPHILGVAYVNDQDDPKEDP